MHITAIRPKPNQPISEIEAKVQHKMISSSELDSEAISDRSYNGIQQ